MVILCPNMVTTIIFYPMKIMSVYWVDKRNAHDCKDFFYFLNLSMISRQIWSNCYNFTQLVYIHQILSISKLYNYIISELIVLKYFNLGPGVSFILSERCLYKKYYIEM